MKKNVSTVCFRQVILFMIMVSFDRLVHTLVDDLAIIQLFLQPWNLSPRLLLLLEAVQGLLALLSFLLWSLLLP